MVSLIEMMTSSKDLGKEKWVQEKRVTQAGRTNGAGVPRREGERERQVVNEQLRSWGRGRCRGEVRQILVRAFYIGATRPPW